MMEIWHSAPTTFLTITAQGYGWMNVILADPFTRLGAVTGWKAKTGGFW